MDQLNKKKLVPKLLIYLKTCFQAVSYASWLLRYMAYSIENPTNNEYGDYEYNDYNNNALVAYNSYELQPKYLVCSNNQNYFS